MEGRMKRGNLVAMVLMALMLAIPVQVHGQKIPELYNRRERSSMNQLKKGEKALDARKLKRARSYFLKAIKFMEKNYQAYAYLGIVESMRGNLKEAEKRFKESMAMFEPYKILILERRTEYIRKFENIQGASRLDFDKTLNPKDVNGSSSTAEIEYNDKQKMIKEYNDDYAKFKRMKYPAFFHFKYGNMLMAAGREPEAKLQYISAVESDPSFKDTYANLAVCWFIEGNCEEALKAFKKARELKAPINPRFEIDLKKKCGGE